MSLFKKEYFVRATTNGNGETIYELRYARFKWQPTECLGIRSNKEGRLYSNTTSKPLEEWLEATILYHQNELKSLYKKTEILPVAKVRAKIALKK